MTTSTRLAHFTRTAPITVDGIDYLLCGFDGQDDRTPSLYVASTGAWTNVSVSWDTTEQELAAKLEELEASHAAYQAQYEQVAGLAAMTRDLEALGPQLDVADAKLGQVAWVHAKGQYRRGEIVKIGRTRVTVRYAVASSGTVCDKAGDVYLDPRAAELEEAAQVEAQELEEAVEVEAQELEETVEVEAQELEETVEVTAQEAAQELARRAHNRAAKRDADLERREPASEAAFALSAAELRELAA